MKNESRKTNWLVIAMLVVAVIAISAPMYYYRIMGGTVNDFGGHIVFTYSMLNRAPLTPEVLGHPLLQVVLSGMVWISRWHIDPFAAMIILQVACQVALALILYFWFGKLNRKGGDWLRALLAASLTIVAPVLALIFVDNEFYYGYINLANYHNPTIQLLRPLALISFYFAFRIFDKARNPGWMVGISAVFVVLSALAKPNYVLCILPAIVLLAIIWRIRKQDFDWRLLLFGFVIPGTIILIVQWALVYGIAGNSETHIVLNPFVEGNFSNYLPWKFLLSILFPLVATGLFFKRIWRDPYVQLGWIGFAAGAGMFYLFSEGGKHMLAGNFRWGAQIMLFLLFAAIVRFCLRLFSEEKTVLWKRLVVWGVFLLHVASGVVYYIHCITGGPYT
jgi:hypothetical protein